MHNAYIFWWCLHGKSILTTESMTSLCYIVTSKLSYLFSTVYVCYIVTICNKKCTLTILIDIPLTCSTVVCVYYIQCLLSPLCSYTIVSTGAAAVLG